MNCKKRRYRDERAVKQAVRCIYRRHKDHQSYYFCGTCQAWHTGHPLRYGKKLIELIDQTMKESA